MIKSTLKIARYCFLVIQGFSNFLRLFQVIMANPEISHLGLHGFFSFSAKKQSHHQDYTPFNRSNSKKSLKFCWALEGKDRLPTTLIEGACSFWGA